MKGNLEVGEIEFSAEEIARFLNAIKRTKLIRAMFRRLGEAAAQEIDSELKEKPALQLLQKLTNLDIQDVKICWVYDWLRKKPIINTYLSDESLEVSGNLKTEDGRRFSTEEITILLRILLADPHVWSCLIDDLHCEIYGNRPYWQRKNKIPPKDPKLLTVGIKIVRALDPCNENFARELLEDSGPFWWSSDSKEKEDSRAKRVREELRKGKVLSEKEWWEERGKSLPRI